MNRHVTTTACALAALGFFAAGAARAAISPGLDTTTTGEIFWTVWDPVNLVTYTRDSGMSILDFLADPSASFSFSPDDLYLDTFGGVDPSTLLYSVGAFNPRNADFPAAYGFLISSNSGSGSVTLPDVTALFTAASVGGFYVVGANANDGGDPNDYAANLSGLSHSGDSGYWGSENWCGNIGNTVPFTTDASVGDAIIAWTLLLGEDGLTVNSVSYGNFLIADDGTFSYSASAVPVPAAVWLFGSALLGLVTRRRRS